MKKKIFLFSLGSLLMSSMLFAQAPSHEKYVKDTPTNGTFHEAYSNWAPGSTLFDNYDDDEFYISRVKPHKRFVNSNSQVDKSLNSDRKLLWWCPIGTTDGGNWNAIPSYHFDSEVFSMWSYLDTYGNWTAPFIRMPAAFTDICHKNGVVTTVLASVPWAHTINSTDGGHGSNMKAMIDGGSEKLLKFLRCYGIDGIGYNSEFNIGSGLSATALKELLAGCFAKKDEMNWPSFSNTWYSLMSNAGYVGGSSYLNKSSNGDWFNYNGNPTSNAYFMNYGWGSGNLSASVQNAKEYGRSSFDVYGGMNFQGRDYANWKDLENYDISIGIWGAHNMNMIFEGRGELGSDLLTKQEAYQLISENVFTGSSYNPVNTPEISNLLSHTTTQTRFHGFSSFITARSALIADNLAAEPFVTCFNLGNGLFFNINGEKQFNNEWYNIGMQDYLPTWRWWWTKSFMGREDTDVPTNGMSAKFTWDDAWFGGSCLAISGQTDVEYLQLFKTEYPLQANDELLIRYKIVSGTGDIYWSCAAKDQESTAISSRIIKATAPANEWIEKIVKVGNTPTALKMVDKTLSMLGLRFENTTNDFKVLVGEVSLTRGTTTTPTAPTIRKVEIMASNYKGSDFKVVYKMKDKDVAHPEVPIYNSDVNTLYYKIYSQQKDAERVLCTATTSWASYVVGAPIDVNGSAEIRIGVAAVSLDTKSESAITWSDYKDIPIPTVVEGIQIDKSVIKANEDFTISYIDPTHSTAKWEIKNAQTGDVIGTPTTDATSLTTSLSEIGLYDLYVTCNEIENRYQGYIQISGDEVGALPKIETLTANGEESPVTITQDKSVEFAYTGRPADGTVSRGLQLSEKAFGIHCDQLDFNNATPFTLSLWFSPSRFNHEAGGTQLLNIRTPSDPWPSSDWGYIWSSYSQNNAYSLSVRKNSNGGTSLNVDNLRLDTNKWYHYAIVVDYNNGRIFTLYINGKEVAKTSTITDVYAWNNSNVIMFGGKAAGRAGFDGIIDEVQLYKKALTPEMVLNSMKHQTEIPDGLIGYWDFENTPETDLSIASIGLQTELRAGTLDSKTLSEGVNTYTIIHPEFNTGAPFITGSNYQIKTESTWKLGNNAKVEVPATGDAEKGKVTVSYTNSGDYTAQLTLKNGWGSDTKTYSLVTVSSGTGLSEKEITNAYSAYPNPFQEQVAINFENSGNYQINVLDVTGQLINVKEVNVSTKDIVRLTVNGSSGIYFVQIKQGNKTLKVFKLIKE